MYEKEDKKLLANPTKFGIAGFGIALAMLGFSYATVIPLNGVVLATILTMGFVAPFLAGILEYVKGNSYRSATFILLSLFFLTVYIFSTRVLNGVPADVNTLGIFYLAWTVVITIMLCGTFFREMDMKMIMLQVILGFFMLFTLLLAIAEFVQVTGIFITAGALALACAAAILVDFALNICASMRNRNDM